MVLITHDLGVVAGHADRVLVMYAGKPVEIGTVDDIYYHPRMPYTLGLLGSLPRMDSASRPAHPDPGRPALAAQPAARLPVHPALPDREHPSAKPPSRSQISEPVEPPSRRPPEPGP
jgi:ABC-type dipeptide/oligopeptide/nickel transport system ATPase component